MKNLLYHFSQSHGTPKIRLFWFLTLIGLNFCLLAIIGVKGWGVVNPLNDSKRAQKKEMKQQIKFLKNGNEIERCKAAKRLGELKAKEAMETLIEALNDSNEQVVAEAAWALGELGNTSAVDPLRMAGCKFKKLHPTVEKGYNESCLPPIYCALDRLMTNQVLIRLLKEGSDQERLRAAEELGEKKAKEAVAPLINSLNDPVSPVRSYAGWALGRIGDQSAVKPLIIAAVKYDKNPTDWLRPDDPCVMEFLRALEKLTGKKPGLKVENWQEWWERKNKKQ